MRNPRSVLLVVLLTALTGLAPASALAKTKTKPVAAKTAPTNAILRACEHNGYQLPDTYSIAALNAAYNAIPVAAREYQTCAQVISNKISAELQSHRVKNTGGGGGGGGFPVVIVVIVVIVLIGAGGAFYSYRRNRQ
jgi:hypothetical protein